MTEDQETTYRIVLGRRAAREPVAYITGQKEFWSLDFAVDKSVLIPRPETELLVESTLAALAVAPPCRPFRILDLCTGCGAVAVSLATELRDSAILATDISAEALAVAALNAARHRVHHRVRFMAGDLFEPLTADKSFDVIVANPPYICSGELPGLIPEVRWEPAAALDGGADGLRFYRRISADAAHHLEPGGRLLLEIGAGMGNSVVELLTATGDYENPTVHGDYAGNDRLVAAFRRPR